MKQTAITSRDVMPLPATSGATRRPGERGKSLPVALLGGIKPGHAYQLAEFLLIANISRTKLSQMEKEGFVVRDCCGTPTVLGSDWIDFCANRPKRQGKLRTLAARMKDLLSKANGPMTAAEIASQLEVKVPSVRSTVWQNRDLFITDGAGTYSLAEQTPTPAK